MARFLIPLNKCLLKITLTQQVHKEGWRSGTGFDKVNSVCPGRQYGQWEGAEA